MYIEVMQFIENVSSLHKTWIYVIPSTKNDLGLRKNLDQARHDATHAFWVWVLPEKYIRVPWPKHMREEMETFAKY